MTFNIGWLKDLGERAMKDKTPDAPEPTVTQKKGDQGQVIAHVSSESEKPLKRSDVDKNGQFHPLLR